MSETRASAPGKVILFGEHAVVYGYPAIAAPVTQVWATAVVRDGDEPGVRLIAPDFGHSYWLDAAAEDDALATAVRLVQVAGQIPQLPDLTISISGTIPIASGMGSGAAVATAMIRALVRHLSLSHLDDDEQVSRLTFEVERIHHGTPSGIDNTVVAYQRPVYFVRAAPANRIETVTVGAPIRLLIGNTGVHSATRDVVGDVRRQWELSPEQFEALFAACGRIADAARTAVGAGDAATLGQLMDENHTLLQMMTVSCPELDQLTAAAREAGALGAKLSGAGRGGNMIALVTPKSETAVRRALLAAGARSVIASVIEPVTTDERRSGG